jgi:N utilization substance protein B
MNQDVQLCSDSLSVHQQSLSMRDQRALVLHLLYAMDAFDYEVTLTSVIDNLNRGYDCCIPLQGALYDQAQGIIDEREELDEELKPLLDNWRFDRLGCCTRLIMRLSLWELKHTDTPASVVMNEAIELTKGFAEQDAYKFVNGVLDEWVKRNRGVEIDETHEIIV